jgi:hypothetical protein
LKLRGGPAAAKTGISADLLKPDLGRRAVISGRENRNPPPSYPSVFVRRERAYPQVVMTPTAWPHRSLRLRSAIEKVLLPALLHRFAELIDLLRFADARIASFLESIAWQFFLISIIRSRQRLLRLCDARDVIDLIARMDGMHLPH